MKLNLEHKLIIGGLLVFFSVSIFFSDSYLPSLPSIMQSLQASHAEAKMTITAYLLGLSLAPLILGPLSDYFGRKKVLLLGLSLALLGSFLCFISNSIYTLILGRFIQGTGAAAASGIGRTVMSDLFQGKILASIASMMGMIIGIVPAFAPVLGGYVHHLFGWRGNFALMLIIVVLAFIYLLIFIPETNKSLTSEKLGLSKIRNNYLEFFKNSQFLAYVMSATLAFGSIVVYITISPFLFQNVLGLTPVQYGWLAVIFGVAIVMGAFLNSRLLHFFETYQLILGAGMVMLLSSGVLFFLGVLGYLSVFAIVVPIFFFATGAQLVFGNSFSLAMHVTPAGRLGYASALYTTIFMGGGSLISILAALVHSHNQIPLGALFICINSLFLANAFLIRKFARKSHAGSMAADSA